MSGPGTSASTSANEQRKLASALGLVGGFLMTTLPFIVSNTIYPGPACLEPYTSCPGVLPASLQGTIFFLTIIAAIAGIGTFLGSAIVGFRNVKRIRRYGWMAVLLSVIDIAALGIAIEISSPYSQGLVLASTFLVVPGPLLGLASGWFLLTENRIYSSGSTESSG